MIFIKNNENNPILLRISKSINTCSEFVFEFSNETSKKKQYFSTSQLSSTVSAFDLFELEEDSSIPYKRYSISEPINLVSGQYTCYIYKCDEVPLDDLELDLVINNKTNLIYATKMVVSKETATSFLNKKYQ